MILPEEEGRMANYMKSPSEIRVRVVMGMSMRAFYINLTLKVSMRACSLSSTLLHSHLKTLLSFIILQTPCVLFFRVAYSHSRESSGRKMQLELVVNTTSFAELMEISPSSLSLLQVFLSDKPADKQDITSLAPSCMAVQVICDALLRVYFMEMSPMERVPVLERGCRKIVAT